MSIDTRAADIFARAAEVEEQLREDYVKDACGEDAELRLEVQRLLVDAERADSFFACDDGVTLGAGEIEAGFTEHEGDQVGSYILRERIGEGGFGVVWMAEQSEPITRMVALKVVKAGMDTRQVLARFEAERQALAMMDHANIARVLDAGATKTGRPYFAMELVKGIPITEFCDDQKYGARRRLELFQDVCSAVNHAHQKGIIHRDLKPSNVMVTLHGDKPVVKVIDFGIAKATHGKLTDKTLYTRFQQFLGTPVYMSPEQAAMSGLDIDTRSDIYSLGVLLYELLAGTPPFDSKSLLSAGYDEMRRIIREEEPPKPSTRLTQSEAQTGPGPRRKLNVSSSALKGELDWIVMKAIEKDRSQRYETANAFAADLGRYLDNEPVLAAAPSRLYKVRKFARRNRAAVGVTATVVVLLVAGIAATAWQAVRATSAEHLANQRRAEAEEAKGDAEAVAGYLVEIFQSPDPARDGLKITVVECLDRAVENLEADLGDQPARQASLRLTLARTYMGLGFPRRAVPLTEAARDYYLNAPGYGKKHPDTLSAMDYLAKMYEAWGNLENDRGRLVQAMKLWEEVLELRREVLGDDHENTLRTMQNLGYAYRGSDLAPPHERAVLLFTELVERRRKVNGQGHIKTLEALAKLAQITCQDLRMDDAERMIDELLKQHRKRTKPDGEVEYPWYLTAATGFYEQMGRFEDALAIYEELVEFSVESFGRKHRWTLDSMSNLGGILTRLDRREEALEVLEQLVAISLSGEVAGRDSQYVLAFVWRNLLVDAYLELGRWEEALEASRVAVEHIGEADSDNAWALNAMRELTGVGQAMAGRLLWEGRSDDYQELARSMLDLASGSENVVALRRAADIACLAPQPDREVTQTALAHARKARDLDAEGGANLWTNVILGMATFRNGQYAEAEEILMEIDLIEGPPGFTAAYYRAMSLLHQDKQDDARELFTAAESMMRPLPCDDHDLKLVSKDDLVFWLAYREAGELLGLPLRKAPRPVKEILVPPTAEWAWLHPTDGVDPAESDPDFHRTFFAAGYDDTAWQRGQDSAKLGGGFGYGEYDYRFTEVQIGFPGEADENGQRNGKSAYFRHRFKTTKEHRKLELRCQRDDGIIIYLDGQEVARDNMSEGAEAYDLPAASSVGGAFETTTYAIPLGDLTLPAGEHILAISLHNPAVPSSDLHIGRITLVELE